ncbi:hypothetical protein FVEG_09380 [Fusarium verticillioides 7600]|uniref:Uncharacterized protein n=1 Tax=Gibberella moniliformis (strain M3125 / FGSC 7600) TaxID=334819 RepID=W7MEQ7_GIBM7|nr:hypothetical protein FVEG_09380 [Fusarium verticillioides 7600]EWG50048.1 hypothetical protein FVEG_09380 [Fusarium verticillioides 7600]
MAAATPILEKHPRGPAEPHQLDARSADCAYSVCNGGCGQCSGGSNFSDLYSNSNSYSKNAPWQRRNCVLMALAPEKTERVSRDNLPLPWETEGQGQLTASRRTFGTGLGIGTNRESQMVAKNEPRSDEVTFLAFDDKVFPDRNCWW